MPDNETKANMGDGGKGFGLGEGGCISQIRAKNTGNKWNFLMVSANTEK